METVRFRLNGKEVEAAAEPGESLLDVLKGRLGVLSVRRGCDEGQCGACTVLLNGKAVLSCIMPFEKANGKEVTTLEGLKDDPLMKALQEQFVEAWASQCGYCTSGFLLTLYSYFKEHMDELNDENVRERVAYALTNNLCRCGAYKEIEEAAFRTFKLLRKR